MTRTAARSIFTLAVMLSVPLLVSAQATQSATPVKPATAAKPAATAMAKPAAAAMAKPAAAAMPKPAATAPSTPAATATPATPGPARDAHGRFIAKSAAPSAANHATCKDGTAWSGAQRSGACARHGGVKQWN